MQMKKTSLCLALAAIVGTIAAAPAMAAGPNSAWANTATHAHELAATATTADLAEASLPVHVEVVLKLQNRSALDDFIKASQDPANALFHARLSTADAQAMFSPSQAQVQAVVDHLRGAGFSNIQVSANRLIVSADGNAGSAQNAFATRLVKAHDAEGRAAYANIDDAKVPAHLGDSVLAVVGLQTVAHPHTMLKLAARSGTNATTGVTGHNPTAFPTIYNVGSTPNASTITVGIISDGNMTQPLKDLASFTSANGLPAVNTQVVTVGTAGTDTSGTPEWDLDSQDIVAMSGGVGKLIFYAANSLSNSALTQAYNQVVTDNQARVINVSLGECETSANSDGSMAADDQIFALGVAQGQTFSVSTGDSGSNECSKAPRGTTPSYPASSPYVVAVSGTTLSTGTGNSWAGETLWSKAGGSPSTLEPKPSWQTQGGGTTRDVADVAMDADPNSGSIIIVNGSNAQYGGTSLAAPLFAATWARMLAGHSTLGFAGPHLYQMPATVYHDITSGSNGGETATAGWDYASGFGSTIVTNLNSSL
ncbi:S53 family peptidase [Dyella sp. SG609]|uniref:S53 family peptidase n=1 Tax=Dyella sp. SG609 TaxID=2587018 RepID=UPI001446ED15|nr:S53 family peptidase [Dyella sp. SG609]NKJ23757.1 pseudomonalisin/xanthomonalisin [Dyella sp. SG609]